MSNTSAAMMDVEQVAQHLNLSISWIYQMVGKREIPCYRIGRALRFDTLEIENWLIQHRISSKDKRLS